MLTFAEALQRVVSNVAPLGSERVPLRQARGRVLFGDLLAGEPLPRFDYSAMDGYAVNSRDVTGPGPWRLQVEGESRAGSDAPALQRGTACRIFTGAPIPAGADAVVLQEDTQANGNGIELGEAPEAGQHVRRRGEDLERSALALAAGTRLGAYQLGLAAALDQVDLSVARRPRVNIVSTGDELRAPGEPGSATSVPESNSLSVAILAEQAGAEATLWPRVADDRDRIRDGLAAALTSADLLITIGGVSVGRYDLVRPALEALGARLDFWKVLIKPGKPLVYGHAGPTHILGLPGNPVSAQITFALFGLPLLRAMQGQSNPGPRFHSAVLLADVRQKPGRMGFYRALGSALGVTPLDNQASGNVVSLAQADALIAVPAESEGYKAGATVQILRLEEL